VIENFPCISNTNLNSDEDHTAFLSHTPKTRRTIGNLSRQWETKVECIFRPYVQYKNIKRSNNRIKSIKPN